MSERAFIGPIPGRSRSRRSRSRAALGLGPDARRIAVVVARDRGARGPASAAAIVPGYRCSAGFSRKMRSSSAGSAPAISRGVERAEPALELERAGEGLLDGHLLVEDEADQERDRLLGEERVGLVVAREVEAIGARRRHTEPILVRFRVDTNRASHPRSA